jgi:dodecin
MPVAKTIEITSTSSVGFDDAIRIGIARASKTVDNVSSAWVKDQEVEVSGGQVTQYRVRLAVTFLLKD